MEYFFMKTDRRLRRLPQIQLSKELFKKEDAKTAVVYVRKCAGLRIDYADYLEHPKPLIAEKFHRILQKYQQDMAFRNVMLVDRETGEQNPYCLMIPPEIICADEEESKYDAGGKLRNFVLDVKKVGKQRIFLAKDGNRQLIVRLDVAESILRREANGIWFEPVQTAGRSK